MSQASSKERCPYRRLGDKLLERLQNDQPLIALADPLEVSITSIHLWMSGKCRPRATRLGFLAAILGFTEEDVAELTLLANYDCDQHEKAIQAFRDWPDIYRQKQLARSVPRNLTDWISKQIVNDDDFRRDLTRRLRGSDPMLYAEAKEMLGW